MYHRTRGLHRWLGLIGALFILTIASSGFLLATKGTFGWIRPPEAEGQPLTQPSDIVSLEVVAAASFARGLPELRTMADIDRIDYRPGRNIFKVVSKQGYLELQIDGSTAKVLQVARRNDQLAEDIHDLSFFSGALHDYGLPLVAVVLFTLAATGLGIFFTPVVRRRRLRIRMRAGEYTSTE